jgi:cell wall assembly regulator SMI1
MIPLHALALRRSKSWVVMELDADVRKPDDLRRLVAGAFRAPEDDPPTGASPAELTILADRLGQSLPAELRTWLSICQGAAIGPGGVLGQRPDRPHLEMVKIREIYPQWRALGWLPIASDGCGNYYVLAKDGTVGFIEPISDPGTISQRAASGLLSFMTDLLAADQSGCPAE